MEQLLLHLVGDYVTQTDYMAKNKTTDIKVAFLHSVVYTLPFWVLTNSITAILVMLITHAIIDRYRLAKFIIFSKNWITDTSLKWDDCKDTGFPSSTPVWLAVWLMIITDNTIHLVINYFALKML